MKRYISILPQIYFKPTIAIILLIFIQSCISSHCKLEDEDLRYVYPDNSIVVYLENGIDTVNIQVENTKGTSESSPQFGLPDLSTEDYISSYLDLEFLNATLSVMKRACDNYTDILFSFNDSNFFSIDTIILDTTYITETINICNKEYSNYVQMSFDSGYNGIQELVYCKDYQFIKLIMEDGYTLELIEIKEREQ